MNDRAIVSLPRFPLLMPLLVAAFGLFGSLGMALMAQPGVLRVAVLALPGFAAPWAAIDRSGLPVVRVLLGGLLVVVDGSRAPAGMAMLRAAPVVLLDAALVPGCSDLDDMPLKGAAP